MHLPGRAKALPCVLALLHISCGARDPQLFATEAARVRAITITEKLEKPWSLAFLPDGDILVTELRGDMRIVRGGRLLPEFIAGLPPVETRDQAGLMDVALHPRFAENHQLFFTYSKKGARGNTPALARATLSGMRLEDVHDIFVAEAWSDESGGNTGSRVVFGADGALYMSVGERHEQTPAQDMATDKGKIVRVRDDGSVPEDNPFVGRPGARPEIFALGVRNPQGLFVDPATGALWEKEHGPLGGDELNVIAAGGNYGWPAVTFGKNYDGTTISKDTARTGMEPPIEHWVPSISPSGLMIYSGAMIPEWRGNVFLGALSGTRLRRLVVDNGRVTHQEALAIAPLSGRIRDVREGPDGGIYVLVDVPGTLVKVESSARASAPSR